MPVLAQQNPPHFIQAEPYHGTYHRHGYPCQQFGIQGNTAGFKRFQAIPDQANQIVAQHHNRQPFHGFLQAQLQLGPMIHGFEQIPILLLQGNIDPGT